MSIQLSPIGLTAQTESGTVLGKVSDVLIEPDTQSVVMYVVKPGRLLAAMVSEPLMIHRTQVIEFTETHMVVDDAAGKKPATEPTLQPAQPA